jgi:asparagine synthetase B (glutamine-hydrolysing)
MCGFAGFLDRVLWRDETTLAGIAGRMADTLRLRGPDDGGTWAEAGAGYAVGFRRLAIVDLSPEGHQPMSSASDRYMIAFNGEVYNHAELRKELLQDNVLRLSRSFGYGSDAGGHRALGSNPGRSAFRRHVRPCPVGSSRKTR